MRCSPSCCCHCRGREAVTKLLLLLLRDRGIILYWSSYGEHGQAAPAGLPERCCTGLHTDLHSVAAGAQSALHPRKHKLWCHDG